MRVFTFKSSYRELFMKMFDLDLLCGIYFLCNAKLRQIVQFPFHRFTKYGSFLFVKSFYVNCFFLERERERERERVGRFK